MKCIQQQIGDTLVEVMIAMAVMGMILSIAYTTAGAALRTAQQAQERSQAIKVAENQIERLKVLAPSYNKPNAALNIFRNRPFCIDESTNLTTDWASGTPSADVDADTLASPPYPAACINGNRYYFVIQYDSTQNDLFTTLVRWERIGGGRDEIKVVYHLHQQ
jgi:prepilin-type N-terminal cleavage/methylation domain-containing protein